MTGSGAGVAARVPEPLRMMLKQEITIILSGKADTITPESVAVAVESLAALLKSVDSNLWQVGKPRYRWKVTAVGMRSPFRMKIEADLLLADSPHADVAGHVMGGLRTLDQRTVTRVPAYFKEADLAAAKALVEVYRDSVSNILIESPDREPVSPSLRVARNVDRLTEKPKANPFDAYGSIDGTLRRATIDPRPGRQKYELQIIDRITDQVVECDVSPTLAERLSALLGKRVVLYGIVRYTVDHIPTRIAVSDDDYQLIDDTKLPSLDDLHRIGISITGGQDAADYVEGLRGNAE